MKLKLLFSAVLISLLLGMPAALAASANYYAKTTVYFNVPKDATFSIAMPSDYGSWTQITGTDDSGSETSIDLITFNFTAVPQAALQQPYQLGASANAQAGSVRPIIWIDNTGTGAEKFEIKASAAPANGITLWYNCTCTGTCAGTETTAITNITTAYAQLTDALETDEYLNVTLFANTTNGVVSGVSNIDVFIKSTAN